MCTKLSAWKRFVVLWERERERERERENHSEVLERMNLVCNYTNFKCSIDLCHKGPRAEII